MALSKKEIADIKEENTLLKKIVGKQTAKIDNLSEELSSLEDEALKGGGNKNDDYKKLLDDLEGEE